MYIEDQLAVASGAAPVRLITLSTVMEMVGFARSSIYKMMGQDRFPKPVHVGPRSVRWIESEIREWISALGTQRENRAEENCHSL